MDPISRGRNSPRVEVIRVDQPSGPRCQLGQRFSATSGSDRREQVHMHWTHSPNPRQPQNTAAGITSPLHTREQTQLSYRVTPQLRRLLNSESTPSRNNPSFTPSIDEIKVGAEIPPPFR